MKENEQETSLQLINEKNFIYKVKKAFRKIFFRDERGSNTVEEIVNIVNENNIETKNEFIKYIKIETNEELLSIQRKLENGKITMEELTEGQKDDLINLYDKQIAIKKEKLNNIKSKIINIRKELAV